MVIFWDIIYLYKNIKGGDLVDITDVRVFLSTREGSTRAYATVTFDESFVVRDLRIVDGKNGLFVSMPSRKSQDGEFRDICFPITSEFRNIIQEQVLDKYNREVS